MNRNILWIETGRTLAMAVIVAWHSLNVMAMSQGRFASWAEIPAVVLTFAVPMFFVISGYLAQKSSATTDSTWLAFTLSKVSTILIPFLTWNIIYMIFFNLLWGWPIWTMKTLWYLLTGYIHLWFVFVLMQFLLLHKLLIRCLKNRGPEIVMAVAMIFSICFYGLSSHLLMTHGNDHHFFEWHFGKICIAWAMFYFWGVYLAAAPDRLELLCKHISLLGLLTVISFLLFRQAISSEVQLYGDIVRHYFLLPGLPFQFIAPTFVLVVCVYWEKKGLPGMEGLAKQGKDTFGIYLAHIVPLYLLLKAWKAIELPLGPIASIAPAMITWFFCIGLVRLSRLRRWRIAGKLMFGGR